MQNGERGGAMPIDRSNTRRSGLMVLTAAIAAVTLIAPITGVAGADSSVNLARRLERLKHATGAYHNEALALASGFHSTDHCVASPAGLMGYHYTNPGRLQDSAVDPDKPEMLLYAPGRGDERKLVGVEYWKADKDQDLSTDGDRPTLFGRPFDGPMPGHEPGMPVHYDLHVWVWTANPDGLFAPFNPRLRCPKD